MYDYFNHDFSKIFFSKNKYVQEKLRIVGPVRLRTIHTLETDCKLETELNKCYFGTTADADLYKEDIDGVKFNTCEENGIGHSIVAESMVFPCSGYVVDIDA